MLTVVFRLHVILDNGRHLVPLVPQLHYGGHQRNDLLRGGIVENVFGLDRLFPAVLGVVGNDGGNSQHDVVILRGLRCVYLNGCAVGIAAAAAEGEAKPAAKKTTTKKAADGEAKPAAKKTTTTKKAADGEAKPAAKKATTAKKPAAKKTEE